MTVKLDFTPEYLIIQYILTDLSTKVISGILSASSIQVVLMLDFNVDAMHAWVPGTS